MKLAALSTTLRQKVTDHCARLLPYTRRVQRELPPHLGQIHQAAAELDAAMGEVEARFLEISTTVENTTTTGRELVELGEALIALALGQGGGQITIEHTAENIWRSIEFVEGSIKQTEQLIVQLTAANAQINHSLSAEQALTRTLGPLTYVQSLFRVESARLSPEVQSMFHALVQEMERVRQHVEDEFRDKFQLIRDIQAILQAAIGQLEHRAILAQRSVSELRTQLTASLTQMRLSYEATRDRDTRLTGVSQTVARETGNIVMSLQFYDTFTQKLQHARKILAEMETGAVTLPSERRAAVRQLRFLEQSGRICTAQLSAMITELTQAGATVSAGLQGIVQQMTALDDDCIALRDIDSVSTGVDGAVQILLDSLADVQRLVGEAERFALESHQTIAPIGGKTTNFTRFIHNLSFEIQLIGLNSEVQSAHVGEGTGLVILSAQTSAISRETSELSTKLAVDLDALTAGLSQMVLAFQDIRERSMSYNRTLTGTAATDSASLHDYRNSALKVLHQIGDLLPRLQAQTRTATEQADFVGIATEPLSRLQAAVTGLTDAAQTAADRARVQVDTTGLTDHFLKLYTMSTEGDVHRRALGQAPVVPPPAPAASGDLDMFGFDEPAPVAAPAGPAPSLGGVELFGFDEPTPAAATAGPAPSLGGVELFGFDEPVAPAPVVPPPAPAPPALVDVDLWIDDPPAASPPAPPPPADPNQRNAA